MRATVYIIALASLAFLSGGCKEDMTPVDGWTLLNEELFGDETNKPLQAARSNRCPLGRRDYCVEDDAWIKAAVQPALDKHADGNMPTTRSKARKIRHDLRYAYGERLRSEEGVAKVRALIRARFESPVSGIIRGEMVVDYGVVPFDITTKGKGFAMGPLTEADIWLSRDLGQRLQTALKVYPEAERLHLVVRYPEKSSRGGGITLTVRHVQFRRGGSRLVKYTGGNKTRYIATLPAQGLAALIDGTYSMEASDLEACRPRSRRGETPGELCRP